MISLLRRIKFTLLSFFFLALLVFISCGQGRRELKHEEIRVEAPFAMPPIKVPEFSECDDFSITDFGAVEKEKISTTKAISQAIAAASDAGGGRVIIPAGEWFSGKIHLKSNVNLHLSEGAILTFSGDPQDYLPAVHTTWEGIECYNYSPLIYAYKCENVAITGAGQLKAEMGVWKRWFARPPAHMNSLKKLYHMAAKGVAVQERVMVNDTSHLRPQFIQFNRCKNVRMEGVTIINSPFWVIHPYMCHNVVIRNVKVYAHGHNNDGVDPEMCENVLIEDCVFDQGDDAIAIKSGRNQDAWRLNTPSRNIVVRNCLVKNGHQLLAIGSELSGGVENVFLENCTVEENARMFHLVFIKTNERRGGYVKNVYVQNVTADKMSQGILGIDTDVLYQWRDLVPTYEKRLTPISDVYLTNIKANKVNFLSRILAQDALPVKNIRLKNIRVEQITGERLIHNNVVNFQLEE